MKLHLGCGDKILTDFINVDIRPLKGVDMVDNISTLQKVEDNSIELIYACHVLEHFNREEYEDVLQRWYNVLKDKGILRISVPDLQKVMEKYNEGMELKKLIGFLYGGQTHSYNYHYMGFDFTSLKEILLKIGFKEVRLWNWRETEHSSTDDFSQAYLPHMDKEKGELMSLNIEALK